MRAFLILLACTTVSACDYGTCCGHSSGSVTHPELISYAKKDPLRCKGESHRLEAFRWLDIVPDYTPDYQEFSPYCLTQKEKAGCTPCSTSGSDGFCKFGEVCECKTWGNVCRKVPPGLLPHHMKRFEKAHTQETTDFETAIKAGGKEIVVDMLKGKVKSFAKHLVYEGGKMALSAAGHALAPATEAMLGQFVAPAAVAGKLATAMVSIAALGSADDSKDAIPRKLKKYTELVTNNADFEAVVSGTGLSDDKKAHLKLATASTWASQTATAVAFVTQGSSGVAKKELSDSHRELAHFIHVSNSWFKAVLASATDYKEASEDNAAASQKAISVLTSATEYFKGLKNLYYIAGVGENNLLGAAASFSIGMSGRAHKGRIACDVDVSIIIGKELLTRIQKAFGGKYVKALT